MSAITEELIRPNVPADVAFEQTTVGVPVASEAATTRDDMSFDSEAAPIGEGNVDAFASSLATRTGNGYGEYVPTQEQKRSTRIRTAMAAVAVNAYGLAFGAGIGDGSNHERTARRAHKTRALIISYSAVGVVAGFVSAMAQAKGMHVSSIPGLDVAQYIAGSHQHAAGAHEALASATPVAPTTGGNSAPITHAQMDAYTQTGTKGVHPNSSPAPSPSGTEATPPAATPSPTPTGSHSATGAHSPAATPAVPSGAPKTPGTGHPAVTPPATGTHAPAAPATGTVKVHELNGSIHREWADAADTQNPTAPGSPRADFMFEHTKTGMTLDLKDATKGTLLPDGHHLTAEQLKDAKVVITFNSADAHGKLTQHVVELDAPGGKLTVDSDVAKLIQKGDYSTIEVGIPGAGKGTDTILSTVVGGNNTVDAKTLIHDLSQPATGKPAVGGVMPQGQVPIQGAKPMGTTYPWTLNSTKPGVANVAIAAPNVLDPHGHSLSIPFDTAQLPKDIKLPTTPAGLQHFHLSPHQTLELEHTYETNAANLQKTLKAQGLQADIINPKTGQTEHFNNAGQLATALREGGEPVVEQIGSGLSKHNLVAPAGWKVSASSVNPTLTFKAPNGAEINVKVPPADIKSGTVNYQLLEGPIKKAFQAKGYNVGFSDGFKMTITPEHPAGQGATPVPTPTGSTAKPTMPATGSASATPSHTPTAPATTHPASPSPTPSKTSAASASPTVTPTGAGSSSAAPSPTPTGTHSATTAPTPGGSNTPPAAKGSEGGGLIDIPALGGAGITALGVVGGLAYVRRRNRRNRAAGIVPAPAANTGPAGPGGSKRPSRKPS